MSWLTIYKLSKTTYNRSVRIISKGGFVERRATYLSTSLITRIAKDACNIPGRNEDLTDDEVGEVCRYFAECAPDTAFIEGKPKFGEVGIALMLSIALYEFPWFYQKYELWQRN